MGKLSKYISALDGLRTSASFRERTLARLEEQARRSGSAARGKGMRWALAAAAAAVAVFAVVSNLPQEGADAGIALKDSSTGVSVAFTDQAPPVRLRDILMDIAEEELLNGFETSIFSGTVKSVRNIRVDMGGAGEYYWSIATIAIDEVYRGGERAGDEARVLLRCPVDAGVWVEDTEVVSSMRAGQRGIFMPRKYGGDETLTEGGETFCFKDIADYGFPDGERFAFLEGEEGLVFARFAYASLLRARTLEDVRAFVLSMIR